MYCNGVTCLKSYEGAERATAAGVANVVAYDAGIPDWAVRFPDKTLLLGKLMSESKRPMISDSAHAEHLLNYDSFKKAATAANAMVIDVRDSVQKSGVLPGLEKAVAIPLDKFIPNFVKAKANQDKKLLIFDQVGKQVVWLEYYLIENGYKDYVFLKGGATSVLGSQDYK
jgi:rhodanese-related sulfurtransferase